MEKPIWELNDSQIKEINKKKKEVKKSPSSSTKSPIIIVKNNYFFLSQSFVKEIIDQWDNTKEVCWKQLNHYYIEKDVEKLQTLPMLYGNYFETLAIGSGIEGKITTEDDIPRKKNGAKKIDTERVEIQADRFKKLCRDKEIIIDKGNTQVPLARKLDSKSNVVLKGVIDIFPTILQIQGKETLVAIDLKLTSDVNSTWGTYCWGKPEFLDHLQADTYMYLIRNLDINLSKELNPKFEAEVGYDNLNFPTLARLINNEALSFIYWVFGYQKPIEELHKQMRMIKRLYRDPGTNDNKRQRENLIRYKRAYNAILYAKSNKYPANPISSLCKNCQCRADKQGDCKLYDGIEEV